MIIFGDSPTTITIDMATALAVAGALSGGIMGASKILISWFRDRDGLKDKIAEEQYTKTLEQHKQINSRYGELLTQVLDDIKVNRAERHEHDKLLFQIQRETVETISDIKNDFVIAISGVQSALQSLSNRVESLETPHAPISPPKLITGETKP